MFIYFGRRSQRARSTSNPPPPKEFVRRTRYEDRNESLQEESYSRRRAPPPRRAFAFSRELEYDGQEYDTNQAPRTEAAPADPGRRKLEPYKPPPNVLTEMQRALWLSCYPDYEENDCEEKIEPNTNEAVAKTTADDKNQQED